MLLLVVSIVALAAGPVVYRLARPAPRVMAALEAFVVTAIGGLVIVHILPEAVAVAGLAAVALAAAGLVGPSAIEYTLRRAAHRTHAATVALAIAGLVLHALFDGVALGASDAADAHGHGGSLLGLAVVLHRVPMALTVWMLLEPAIGRTPSALVLAALGVATAVGFALGDQFLPYASAAWMGLVQALVAGSLLHVVIHRAPLQAARGSRGRAKIVSVALGVAGGLALVAALALAHDPLRAIADDELAGRDLVGLVALIALFAALAIRRATHGGHDHA